MPLIPRYFDLLVFLIERRHEAVSRREIFDRVWSDVIVSDSALSQAIRTLRRTLGEDPQFIRTVSRHGYQFVSPDIVEEEEQAPPQEIDRTAVTDARVPVAQLIASRARQAAGLAPVQWLRPAIGGGLAGMIAGAAGGLLLMASPGNGAPAAVIPVLAAIGAACGAIGGAGVGAGLSAGEASTRSWRTPAVICGAALGGLIAGSAAQWLTRWSLETLVGMMVEVGGGVEGLVIGAAAGAGYVSGRRGLRAVTLMTVLCGVSAFALTRAGRPLVGGTIQAVARQAQGSRISLAPLGRLIGEPDFGPLTQAIIGTGEGAAFGLGLALALTRRPSSRTSHETLTGR